MVAADTRVIGLTVTEKGYGGDPASGRLSETDADLAHDLAADQAIADPGLRRQVEALWDEAETTLAVPAGADVAACRRALLPRFATPAQPHRIAQIAMDGSRKLRNRILGTIRDRLGSGLIRSIREERG